MKLSIKEVKPIYSVEYGVRILQRKETLKEIKEEDYKGFFGLFVNKLESILKKYSQDKTEINIELNNQHTEMNIESKTVNNTKFNSSGLVYNLEINIKEKDLTIYAEGFDVYNEKCVVGLIREIEKNIKEK